MTQDIPYFDGASVSLYIGGERSSSPTFRSRTGLRGWTPQRPEDVRGFKCSECRDRKQ